jgi:hypothetical protein
MRQDQYYTRFAAIAPHDTNALAGGVTTAIHNAGAAGTCVFKDEAGGGPYTVYLPQGATLRIAASVVTTASTAAAMVAFYGPQRTT